MAQESTGVDVTPWQPTPTVIPPEWQKHLEEPVRKTKVAANLIAGLRYDGQGTAKLLREWGLPWPVVVAGALLFHNQKEFRGMDAANIPHLLSHIRQARRYIDCIEDEDLSTLLSSPYDDLGALLIAVATYHAALQGLLQHKSKRPSNQHDLSRIESIGSTLLHITKQINLWLFKRCVEDLILQLHDPSQYMDIKEEYQQILQRDKEKLIVFCSAMTEFFRHMMQKNVSITYSACGLEGFLRRRQERQTEVTSQKVQLTGFDLVIFDIIVPTVKDCYVALGLVSFLGFQDSFTDRIANPKLNGSSYLSLNIILKQEPPLQHLTWLASGLYTCHIQIATHPMHAVTNYGCLYPECYKLYTGSSLEEAKEVVVNENLWSSEEGKIYTSIIRIIQKEPG